MLTTHETTFRTWFKQRLPAACTNEEGRTLESGIYLGTLLDEKDAISKKTRPLFLSHHSANQSLHIVDHDHDCQHLYSFAFNQSQSEFLHWTMNNTQVLQNFIVNYKHSARELISEAKKSSNRISLPIDKGQETAISKQEVTNIKIIHADTQTPIYLAKQQSVCLSLLLEGLSAKEIALRMNLSYRTVEHYVARIRQILGCKSNKELIIKYREQYLK